ncbi:ABC transporter substrate-binding protein [Rhodococcus spelaei]|uniref:ABC transporter substrate-binding protein n=1 Tax=Rhodococcus spelaei TaxID=2546320 RepID=A0A541BAA5_9NOCA|nr:ABC transporter substrate-binding protein [Rhodococcus spelaei]TQF69257.1 ABC transporter substrate-binding protein [Rhodococcus spelaei]
MKIRHSALVAAVAASTLALAGCAGSSSDQAGGGGADQPYRVMITAGLGGQGALAANAKTSVLAAKAGAQVVNGKGGVGGRQVELTVVDDGGDPTTAVTKLREAISSNKKPDLFLDSGPSTVALAVLPILKQNSILSFNISPTEATSDPKQFPLNFDLAPGPDVNNVAIAGYAKGKGYDAVGIIHSSSGSGEAYGAAAKKALSDAGIKVTDNQVFDPAALDMTPQLQSLKNSGAKALVVDAYGAPLGYLLQSLQRLDWNVPLIGQTTVSATNLIATDPPTGVLGTPQVANLVTQVFRSTVHDANDTEVNQMVDTMKSLGDIPSTLILADNFDAFQLVAAAADHAGTTTDAKKLAAALETGSVLEKAETAFLPRYNFTADSHAAAPNTDAYKFVAPSKIVNGQFGNPNA